jgi:hypothetical protein
MNVKDKLPWLIVLVVSFYAARHLLLPGFIPTHDGEYHIIRFWQFDKVFRSGNLIPKWAPDLDNGRGVPLFEFFYPLPNYIAEIFILLGFSYVKSLFLVLASGLIVSGLTFYLWMRTLFKPWRSVIGAIFYVLAPYHLVDVFIRGSVGEVWALALVPLVLFFTTKLGKSEQSGEYGGYFFWNSISLFLLLLSHNILGPVFYLFSLLYGVVLNFQRRFSTPSDSLPASSADRRKTPGVVAKLSASYAIGFLLSSFFWIPIYFEKQYVTGLDIVNYKDHFPALYQLLIPSWGTGFSGTNILADQMSFQIGVPHLLVLLGGIFLLRKVQLNNLLVFMIITVAGTLFLTLSVSSFVWQNLSLMKYFQYPWRLLSIVIIITSWLAAYLAEHKGKIIAIGLTIFALLFYLPYTKPVVYKPRNNSFYLTNPTWTKGTATMGNSFRAVNFKKIKEIEKSRLRKFANTSSLLSLILLVIIYRNGKDENSYKHKSA